MSANRGYIGWSMSRRAAEAYSEGKMPKTAFKKHYRIGETTFDYMKDNDLLDHEWHHTSKMFNRTDFWKPTIMGLVYLKNLGNEMAILELKSIAQERLREKFRHRHIIRRNWRDRVLELFPQSWGIAIIRAAQITGRLWENQPALTPQYCLQMQDKINKLGYPMNVSRSKGRDNLERSLVKFLQK